MKTVTTTTKGRKKEKDFMKIRKMEFTRKITKFGHSGHIIVPDDFIGKTAHVTIEILPDGDTT